MIEPIKTGETPPYAGNADKRGCVLAYSCGDGWVVANHDIVRKYPKDYPRWMALPPPPKKECLEAFFDEPPAIHHEASDVYQLGWDAALKGETL